MFLSSRHIVSVLPFIYSHVAIKKPITLFTCLCCFFCAFSAQAQDNIVLDKHIEIGWLRFASAHYIFSTVNQAQGVLQVTDTASEKNCSGYVSCNGKWYVIKNDRPFTSEIALKDTNHLCIVLFGSRGASVHISVLQKENQVHPPEVTFTATPDIIAMGNASDLNWQTCNADSVIIDPEIGQVPISGTVTVSPSETTTYTITATGAGGSVSNSLTLTVTTLSLSIQAPLDGDSVSRPDVMIRGIIDNPSGNEAGVRINETMATVVGNQFVANHVPVEEGWNTITAHATDIKGNTATSAITISATAADDYLEITADRESGVAPFETSLTVSGSFNIVEHILSHSGPGEVDVLRTSAENYTIKITVPGLYFFTAEAVDDQNNTCTDTIAIAVIDPARMDALCRARWDGMKTALLNEDIEEALTYHHASSRTKYTEIYNAIGKDLPTLAGQMHEISLIKIDGLRAKYRIKQDHEIEGQNVTISYYIYFSQDEDGLWRIEKY